MIDIIAYTPELKNSIYGIMRTAPDYMKKDMLDMLGANINNGLLAINESGLCGVACHNGELNSTRAAASVYVKPSQRQKGVGSELVNQIISDTKSMNIGSVIFNCIDSSPDKDIAEKMLLNFPVRTSYKSHYMTCNKQSDNDYDSTIINPYKDEYYDEYRALCSSAFEPIRRKLGITPSYIPGSESERNYMGSNPDNFGVIFKYNKMIAIIGAYNSELDFLAVDENERKKGYGTTLMKYAMNKAINNHGKAELWVLEENPSAERIYQRLGFNVERVHVFYDIALSEIK